MREFLTGWWLLCFVVNVVIYAIHGNGVEFGLAVFSAIMFIRSLWKSLDEECEEDYNSGDEVCERLVERERNRPIKIKQYANY